ncbi:MULTISPECIES: zinc-binding alcohol dehydrogenase family protein [Sorangium]|uniref:Uncharacterized protein n=1 Tax=Sorangium cellulosum TaxID=56 RepID=A0A4P2QQV7_SORCE|nr:MULTISPECIES: zinc-binding alcohol dehydrogenase family protein [Sorangium]AUX32388.1 uncharacterized protein SOCE836_045250 [Sorangium cellulosum]WCQ91762.1 hypothetical protein NQZ70_04485 [Sorangium sp. Soce836]
MEFYSSPPPASLAPLRSSSHESVLIERLNRLVASGPFHVEIARRFALAQAAEAHLALGRHHLGKLALQVH